MLSAFIRLGLISLGSLIVIVLAVVFVRWMGFQQGFAEPSHPWYQQSQWNIEKPSDVCSNFKQSPGAIAYANVHFHEGAWLVECRAGTLPLDQVLKNSPHPDWLLHVKANDSANLDNLVEIVGAHDATKKFGVMTDSQRASRFLRKKSPQWLFAADPASLLRLQIFSSLWIETAMDFWPDFVVATNDASLPTHLNVRMADELIRRHKRIVWQGDENPLIPVQGRIVDTPRQ